MTAEVNVAALRGIGVKDITEFTSVPDDDVARLMYYLHCVLYCIDAIDTNATTRRITDYRYCIHTSIYKL